MKQHIAFFLALTLILTLLAGCGGSGEAGENTTQATVADIFTAPAQTQTSGDATESAESSDKEIYLGSVSNGFALSTTAVSEQEQTYPYADGEIPLHTGRYATYTGGEMQIDYEITVIGALANDGIGLLLILDGIPQPYRTADQEEYTYLHTFYPPSESGGTINFEMFFTPVTGKAGDNLTLQTIRMFDPDYDPAVAYKGLTSASYGSHCQFLMTADPPETEMPAVTERIAELSLEIQDLSSTNIAGWSAGKLQKNYSFNYSVKASAFSDMYFGVTDDTALQVHMEVFSPSVVQWALLLYIDFEPVSVQPENIIQFSTPSGQKAIIDITLDMTGYRENSSIFAVLLPRNGFDPALYNTNCTAAILTYTNYISREENYEAWRAKNNLD